MDHGSILAFCTYLSTTTVLRLSRGVTIEHVFGILREKWPNLLNAQLRLSYSIPTYPTIILDNDLDLDIMIEHCIQSGLHRVDVVVNERNGVSGNVASVVVTDIVPVLTETVHSEVASAPLATSTSSTGTNCFSERWSVALTEVGQVFKGGPKEFRLALAKYAIETGFNYVFKKNDADRVTARCKVDDCPWIVHARYYGAGGDFFIKKWINHHKCNVGIRTVKHDRVSSKLVADLFVKHVRSKPTFRPIEIKENMKTMYGIDVSYFHAWKGKEVALGDVQGEERLSFDRLRAYEGAVLRSNPGSFTSLEYDHVSGKFQRFFIAFGGCIEGFKHCRPMIFLDGTFLKGKYKGILLSATAKNGDQGMYPLCFGAVDVENERNWVWFVQKMSEFLDPRRNLVFVSDRNKGLLEAISTMYPGSPHGFCLEHLKQNLRTRISVHRGNRFREMLVSLFVGVAKACTQIEFIQNMTLFRSQGGRYVEKFLDGLPAVHWANAYFTGCKYGEMTSNIAECFNSWITEERNLPIDVMVDTIRLRLMEQMSDRLRNAKCWTTRLCPTIEKRLQELMRNACNWKVTRSTDSIYEVHSTPTCAVNIESRTCGCREWDVQGFPCAHALAAIQFNKGDIYSYCESYFLTSTFIESYSNPIYPVTFEDEMIQSDDEAIIKAPAMKRPPGRPKRKRGQPPVGQNKKTIRCTRCGKAGNHNRRSCKEPSSE